LDAGDVVRDYVRVGKGGKEHGAWVARAGTEFEDARAAGGQMREQAVQIEQTDGMVRDGPGVVLRCDGVVCACDVRF